MARKGFPPTYEWRLLEEFTLEGEGATQELAANGIKAVIESVKPLQVQEVRLRRLKTAVREAVHNLTRQSVNGSPELPLKIRVFVQEEYVTSAASDAENGSTEGHSPDYCWGFFLVEKKGGNRLMNEGLEKFNGPQPTAEPACHTVELFLYPEG